MMERNSGSIPVDHIGIRELLKQAVEVLHGPEAVAEIEDIQTGPGLEFQENGKTYVGTRMEVKRAGMTIPESVDRERWEDGKNEILTDLCYSAIRARASHPETGREYIVPDDYWSSEISELSFASGTYDFSKDPDLRGRALYFREVDAERFLENLKARTSSQVDSRLFEKPYWSLLQTVAWVFARDRNLVCATSPERESFGHVYRTHTLADGTKRNAPETVYPDAFWLLITAQSVTPRPYENMDDAEDNINGKLISGDIVALGRYQDRGTHKIIPASDWLSLKFQWGDGGKPDWVGVDYWSKQQGGTYWTELRLSREAVLDLWPEDWIEASAEQETPPQNESPTNAGTNLPKVLPDKKAERDWMAQLAQRIQGDDSIILKPKFLELYLSQFPRAPKKHAEKQYKQLPTDVRHDPSAGRVRSEQRRYQGG